MEGWKDGRNRVLRKKLGFKEREFLRAVASASKGGKRNVGAISTAVTFRSFRSVHSRELLLDLSLELLFVKIEHHRLCG